MSHVLSLSVIPAKAGISLNSLTTLIQELRKVSHVFKEIPDIAARFRDDEVLSKQFRNDEAVATRLRVVGAFRRHCALFVVPVKTGSS